MFDAGILKKDDQGRFQAVQDPAESEQIRSTHANATKRHNITEADIDRINADLDKMEDQH